MAQLLATKCEHKDRMHYAHGLCDPCYQAQWHKKRKLAAERAAKLLRAQAGAAPAEPAAKKSKKK